MCVRKSLKEKGKLRKKEEGRLKMIADVNVMWKDRISG